MAREAATEEDLAKEIFSWTDIGTPRLFIGTWPDLHPFGHEGNPGKARLGCLRANVTRFEMSQQKIKVG